MDVAELRCAVAGGYLLALLAATAALTGRRELIAEHLRPHTLAITEAGGELTAAQRSEAIELVVTALRHWVADGRPEPAPPGRAEL
jgi:hypothetical protein